MGYKLSPTTREGECQNSVQVAGWAGRKPLHSFSKYLMSISCIYSIPDLQGVYSELCDYLIVL